MGFSSAHTVVSSRFQRLRRALRPGRGLLVTGRANIRYLSGFTGSCGVLAVTQDEAMLYTAGLYRTQARQQVTGAQLRVTGTDALGSAARWLKRQGVERILFDAVHLSVNELRHLEKTVGQESLQPSAGIVEGLRAIKDREEIAAIRASQKLIARVFEEVLPLVHPGVRELDLAAEIDFRMRRHGAEGPSFDTIVASGPRSALPHGRPCSKCLGAKELVVFDLGAILGGYCSDMTRTVFLGTPSPAVRRQYKAVRDALERSREAVQAGVEAGAVDAAARKVLTKRGFDSYFVHSTGHGLGLEVHEAPRVARGILAKLKTGMVITLEPGAYLPGKGGVRIEDVVVVRPKGAETLTPLRTELICL